MTIVQSRSEEAPESIVEFEIVELKPVQRDGGRPMRVWDVKYPSASGTAHFKIAMELAEPESDMDFPSTRGVLTACEDSRPDGLLAALASAHNASRSVRAEGEGGTPRVREVAFEPAMFGSTLTRGRGERILAGEFTSDRPGPWILVKIFFEAEGAEIYLALNSSEGKGLFMSRYDENWPDLEPFLASVL